jgi:hypothetical protein
MLSEGITIDGIKWVIGEHPPKAVPLCPKDFIKLDPYPDEFFAKKLKCEECQKIYPLPREYNDEQQYVLNKISSRIYKKMRFINLDDEAIPIAEDKTVSKDKKYFVTSRLMKSKTGLRLVVYAGEKGKKEKTQIFVEPEIKRLAFDQKNLHPTDVFTKLEATFSDGTKASLEKKK